MYCMQVRVDSTLRLNRTLIDLLLPCSTLSFPWTRQDWGRVFPLQLSTFLSEYSHDRVTLSLLSRYFEILILASDRAAVFSQCCCLIWYHSHQHFSVRCYQDRLLAEFCLSCPLLARCRNGLSCFQRRIPPHVRNPS